MPTTAEELVKACFWDLLPGIPVVADYFGNAEDEEEERIVFGIYQGLVKFKGVDHDLLFNCFLSDRLDELVHAKYKHGKTGYYQKFCEKNISLKTQTLHRKLPKKLWKPIYDDDTCPNPNCLSVGYRTQKNSFDGVGVDCCKCLKFMCKKCYGGNMRCKTCFAEDPGSDADGEESDAEDECYTSD